MWTVRTGLGYEAIWNKFVCVENLVYTHWQDFSLCDVPECLPEMDIQVLGDTFKFCTPQLWVDGVLSWGKERACCHTWRRRETLHSYHNDWKDLKKRKIVVRGSENWNWRVKTDNTKVTESRHFTKTSQLLIGFNVLPEVKTYFQALQIYWAMKILKEKHFSQTRACFHCAERSQGSILKKRKKELHLEMPAA